MTQRIKNFNLCLINLLMILLISSCSNSFEKAIYWNDLRNDKSTDIILVSYKYSKGGTNKKLITNKTSKLKLKESSCLISVEHDNSYCLKILEKDNYLQFFLFPQNYFEENNEYYLIQQKDDVIAYFVECYDEKLGKNFYIFSKDNRIDKNQEIQEIEFSLSNLLNKFDVDFAVYNKDSQKLANPYVGYVVKNMDGEYILLETLWGQYSFN